MDGGDAGVGGGGGGAAGGGGGGGGGGCIFCSRDTQWKRWVEVCC